MQTTRGLSGDVLDLFRHRGELSRIDVIDASGLSRSTVNQRLAQLLDVGLIEPIGGGESTGGRPSSKFRFNTERACVLAADIGASGFTAAVCDLTGRPLATASRTIEVSEGPEVVLTAVIEAFAGLRPTLEVWGIGIGVPGPVEYAARRVVNPPIMSGWDRFDIAGWFAPHYDAPVVVENDANARAVAEARSLGLDNVIALKLGSGVGAGLVSNGRLIRGDKGAAGDIGHTRSVSRDPEARQCRCGNLDCVEAYAGGWALRRDLERVGIPTSSTRDVVTLLERGDEVALARVRAAGRVVGDAVATLVGVLNPRAVVVSGQLADSGEVLFSGIRERVYQQAAPLLTGDLFITKTRLGDAAGVIGLALQTVDVIFSGEEVAPPRPVEASA
ncbi:ROK family transcriptional regulator [Amnibacterium endophyticum]|uniref:ROK family transcriptional regulator n=1 Tax=Amnibacterium endophyticum TaxID=2109337 RepID=A0ABW4LCZ2_9MICO